MPADTNSRDTISAKSFALQLAERETLRRLRNKTFRLIGGIFAGLAVASFGLRDTGHELVYMVMGMGTAFIVICGYTPRIFRRYGAYVGGVRGQMERDACEILRTGTLTSPRLFRFQRKTRIVNILRGLVLIGLLMPFPISRLIASHAADDAPPVYGTLCPAPQTLREFRRQIESVQTSSPALDQKEQAAQTETSSNHLDHAPSSSPQSGPRMEYLVRHTDRRFYDVGP